MCACVVCACVAATPSSAPCAWTMATSHGALRWEALLLLASPSPYMVFACAVLCTLKVCISTLLALGWGGAGRIVSLRMGPVQRMACRAPAVVSAVLAAFQVALAVCRLFSLQAHICMSPLGCVQAVTRKVRVLDVSYNASNNELVCAMPAVRTLSSVCFVLLVLEVLLAATEGGIHRHGISTHTGAVVVASTVELAVAQPPARCPRPGPRFGGRLPDPRVY